jgi:hypothetical protein
MVVLGRESVLRERQVAEGSVRIPEVDSACMRRPRKGMRRKGVRMCILSEDEKESMMCDAKSSLQELRAIECIGRAVLYERNSN